MMRKSRAFTLIELMVVIAVVAVIAMLAAPSVRELIEIQRLRGINAQVVTDVQFARSEATRLNRPVGIAFASNTTMTCYMVFTGSRPVDPSCNCLRATGTESCAGTTDLRNVQVLRSLNVSVVLIPPTDFRTDNFAFQPDTGGILLGGTATQWREGQAYQVRVARTGGGVLHTQIPGSGRPSVCSPAASVRGVASCE